MNDFFYHSPKYFYLISDNKEFLINIVLASITFLAVLVALFQERIRQYFNSAKLDMKINLVPPDCHKISLTNGTTGQHLCNSIYIRIRISNVNSPSAENAEVILSNFWEITSENNKKVLEKFLPMNLVWSHFQPRTHVIKIPKGISRHCDFGYFAPIGEQGNVWLKLDTITQPNPVAGGEIPNIIKQGKYVFELLISGDNVVPQRKTWQLEFDGLWSEDEKEMLDKHIKIKEI